MWVISSHKRPRKLVQLLNSFGTQDVLERVTLVLWNADPCLNEYDRVLRDLPKTWDVVIGKERSCGEKLNAVYKAYPCAPFYGFLADDVQLGTPNMLAELRRDAENGFFVWPDDGVHGPRLSTHPVAPGKLIRALGFWAEPKFPHNGIDVVLYRIATALDIVKYRPDLKLICNRTPDETYDDAVEWNKAAEKEIPWWEEREMPLLIERVKARYGKEKCLEA